MIFLNYIKYFMLTSLIVTGVFACSGKTETVSHYTEKSVVHQKNAKPGAAIKLISPASILIEPNQVTNIDVLLETTESSGELIVEFTATEGLDLIGTTSRRTINLPPTFPIKIPVSFIAPTNGRYHLNIRASLSNNDSLAIRNLAVIVEVGPQSNPTASSEISQRKKSASENVIPLPAQESISPK